MSGGQLIAILREGSELKCLYLIGLKSVCLRKNGRLESNRY